MGPFLACLLGLAMLLVLGDLFERLEDCFKLINDKGTSLGKALAAIGTFYAAQSLSFVVSYGGLAALAAGALAVAALARNEELVATRAAGVSLRRAFAPLLLFGALCGLGQTLLADTALCRIAPAADDAMDVIRMRGSSRRTDVDLTRRTQLTIWGLGADGRPEILWKRKDNLRLCAKRILRQGRTMEELSIEFRRFETPPPYFVVADRATWLGGVWALENGRFWDYRDDQNQWRPCTRIACRLSPADLQARALGLHGQAVRELFEQRDDPAARVELWRRLLLPLVDLTLLLLGLPLAVIGGSRGGKLLPLGMALVLGAVYVLVGEHGAEIGRSSALLDFLGRYEGSAWQKAAGGATRMAVDLALGVPHFAFLALGAVLYWRMDRD